MRSRVVVGSLLAALGACDDGHHTLPASWPSSSNGATTTGEPASPQRSPACDKTGAKTGVLVRQVPALGKRRSYRLVVPDSYRSSSPYPLVFVLHGHGGNGAQARAAFGLESVAAGGAIFIYPDAGAGGWDLDSPAATNADVGLFDAALTITQSDYCVDLARVFVAGFSNGGYMASQLACMRGDRIRAIASHAGGGPYANVGGEYDDQGQLVCKGKAVASLVVHGLADGTVAPSEGQKTIDHFVHANHCAGSTPTSPAGCVTQDHCERAVKTCKVPGLGHALWGSAARVTWSFFDALK